MNYSKRFSCVLLLILLYANIGMAQTSPADSGMQAAPGQPVECLSCKAVEPNSHQENFTDWGTFFVALFAFLISIVGIWYTWIQIKKERDNREFDFLLEANKMMLAEPCLSAIYDDKESIYMPKSDELAKQELESKLDAFCYYFLNGFELIFRYRDSKRESAKFWKRYFIYLIVHSSRFRGKVEESKSRYVFSSDYQNKMKVFLKIAEKVQPHYVRFNSSEINKEGYYQEAETIINGYLNGKPMV